MYVETRLTSAMLEIHTHKVSHHRCVTRKPTTGQRDTSIRGRYHSSLVVFCCHQQLSGMHTRHHQATKYDTQTRLNLCTSFFLAADSVKRLGAVAQVDLGSRVKRILFRITRSAIEAWRITRGHDRFYTPQYNNAFLSCASLYIGIYLLLKYRLK